MLNRLTQDQINSKLAFIKHYIQANNPADGSIVDANANVTRKTIATLESELYKFENIQLNRAMVCQKLEAMFGKEMADQYIADIKDHLIYIHDETSLKPYCASISLYPFLFEGTTNLGGTSKAPKNLQSFCGSFVNLIYQIASGFAGAIATVEFLMYFDYYARKTYEGLDYLDYFHDEIKQELQGVVYAMNQPASARGDQSIFWNISVFDEYYFKSLFGETFRFPDGTEPDWNSLKTLQAFFMDWFRMERTKELLTFPVVTAAMLIENDEPKDKEFRDMLADQMSKGLSFFMYMSESADSLASCCRLRNELVDNTFSYSLGAGGVSTGSKQVITINFNRMEQKYIRACNHKETIEARMSPIIDRVQKYLLAHNELQMENLKAGLLPAYDAGYISMDKQFLTIGLNGGVEGAEFYGVTISDNPLYKEFLKIRLGLIMRMNKEAYKKYGVRYNTEFVPGESLGVKNAKWDKADGLKVNRDCYNSYFYQVENPLVSALEKMALHGKEISEYLDGGSALHLNLEQLPTKAGAIGLMRAAARNGVPYWTFNVLSTICDSCGHIDPNTLKQCPKCGETDLDYGTRIIGYLKRVSNFSSERQKEHGKRHYAVIGGKR